MASQKDTSKTTRQRTRRASNGSPSGATHSPQSVDWSPLQVGQALRAIRTARGMSINELARHSDLSSSFLSQVETGQSDLSVGRLHRLAQALGVTPADILDVPAATQNPVVRAAERLKLPMRAKGVHVYTLASTLDKKRTFSFGVLERGATIRTPIRNPGSEYFIYVIEGAMRLEYTSGEVLVLEAGDSTSHISDNSRLVANASKGQTTFIWSQAARGQA